MKLADYETKEEALLTVTALNKELPKLTYVLKPKDDDTVELHVYDKTRDRDRVAPKHRRELIRMVNVINTIIDLLDIDISEYDFR